METLSILGEAFHVIRWVLATDITSPPFGEVIVSERPAVTVAVTAAVWLAKTASDGSSNVRIRIALNVVPKILRNINISLSYIPRHFRQVVPNQLTEL